MTSEEIMQARVAVADMLSKISSATAEQYEEFVRGILMLGECILNEKNHGVFLFVENEETMRVIGLNVTLEEAGNIVATALNTFTENLEARDMHRRGETH